LSPDSPAFFKGRDIIKNSLQALLHSDGFIVIGVFLSGFLFYLSFAQDFRKKGRNKGSFSVRKDL